MIIDNKNCRKLEACNTPHRPFPLKASIAYTTLPCANALACDRRLALHGACQRSALAAPIRGGPVLSAAQSLENEEQNSWISPLIRLQTIPRTLTRHTPNNHSVRKVYIQHRHVSEIYIQCCTFMAINRMPATGSGFKTLRLLWCCVRLRCRWTGKFSTVCVDYDGQNLTLPFPAWIYHSDMNKCLARKNSRKFKPAVQTVKVTWSRAESSSTTKPKRDREQLVNNVQSHCRWIFKEN
jgi:hypothetical protein